MNATACQAPATVTQKRVTELLGEDRREAVYEIDHQLLEYGTHWRWIDEQLYTAEGLIALAAGFEARMDEAAGVILRAEAERLERSIIGRGLETGAKPIEARLPYKDSEL